MCEREPKIENQRGEEKKLCEKSVKKVENSCALCNCLMKISWISECDLHESRKSLKEGKWENSQA